MAKALLPDDLWALIQPLLPTYRPSPKGGRPRIDDRAALTGILFVLKTGLPWEYLPRELGCGGGMSCWRRLHAWQQAGSWQRTHDAMPQHVREYDQIQWERASVDSASVPSPPSAASIPAPIPPTAASSDASTICSSINAVCLWWRACQGLRYMIPACSFRKRKANAVLSRMLIC